MSEKCNCKRTKIRSKEEFEKLIHRLNRIEGQIKGVKKMVENNAYCVDILTQSSAVNSAIKAFNKELLLSHLNTCVIEDIKKGNFEKIEELSNLLNKLIK